MKEINQMLANFSVHHLSPNYSVIFNFEAGFQEEYVVHWFTHYWHVSFYVVAIYLMVIFGGQAVMSKRPAFGLRRPLTIWNITLALFSIIGTTRTVPELVHVLETFGFYHSVCNSSFLLVKPAAFWSWMFALSKVPELGDTVFIVLRKQKLSFLHWYHHISVLLFTWFTSSEKTATARWFINMNYIVHSFMYSYYALRSLGFRMPRVFAMFITTLQIIQMLLGAFVTWYAWYYKTLGDSCILTKSSANFAIAMYLSYFVLFAKFFYNAYFKLNKDTQTQIKSDINFNRKHQQQQQQQQLTEKQRKIQ